MSRRLGSVTSIALDVLPLACLVGRGDNRRDRVEWAIDQWVEPLGVEPPQIKLWLHEPGFRWRMLEHERREECLAQEGQWAVQWPLQRLQQTPKNMVQRAVEVVKDEVVGYFMGPYSPLEKDGVKVGIRSSGRGNGARMCRDIC